MGYGRKGKINFIYISARRQESITCRDACASALDPTKNKKNNQSRNLNSAPPGPSEKKNRNRILDSSPTARVIKPTLSSGLKARQRHGAQGILGRLCGAKFYSGFPRAATAISPGRGGYLGQVLLGMCRWLLRTPTPL